MDLSWSEFERIEKRVGTIFDVNNFYESQKPDFQSTIDFGSAIRVLKTSAQITKRENKEVLVRRQNVAVLNFSKIKPIEFRLGQGQVIECWDEGIALLKVGDKARFVIPSELGYGPAGGVISPNATLIFDAELMDVK